MTSEIGGRLPRLVVNFRRRVQFRQKTSSVTSEIGGTAAAVSLYFVRLRLAAGSPQIEKSAGLTSGFPYTQNCLPGSLELSRNFGNGDTGIQPH